MAAKDPSNGPISIDLEEELEGEEVGTTDYFFVKIGEAVPLKGNDSNFDLESLPCQPLAVSERFRLIFVAHSSGFFVARTKDVMDSAKEFKEKGSGSPVQQLNLVDVSIGRVHILALSTDNSTLAASISGDIRFFSVVNFLNKEVKQSFSCSLNDSTFVKDMRWITTSENSYVVLSNTGKLYYGEAGFPLKHVMDSVEAVDWGVKGKFVAVARKNVLSILSAKFEEWVSISLSFRSWIGDSVANCSVKVDSIKCVRPDSIIIGCFQLTGDGKEENYLLQVIRSRDGEITKGCSELVVQSFYDIYRGLLDDIVPFGSGPYLLLTYLERCQLVINGNMKNTDQHIMLLGWSVHDKSEAAVVDIERDNWVPRIELQENGDDNLLLGLCIDNVSIYQKVGVQLGVGETTELSPYCVLICLTLDGKLVMFHVASHAGSEVSPAVVTTLSDQQDGSVKLFVEEDSTILRGLQNQELDQASEVSGNLRSKPFANPHQITCTEDFTRYREVESVANLQSVKPNAQQMVPDVDLNQETDSQNSCCSWQQSTNSGHFSSNAFLEQSLKDLSSIGSQKIAGLGTSIGSPAAPSLPSCNNLKETTEMTKKLWNTCGSQDTQRASHLLSGETVSFPRDPKSFSTSSFADGVGYESQVFVTGATNVLAQDLNGVPPATNFASRPVQSGGQLTAIGVGNMEPFSISSSHLSLTENTSVGKSSVRKLHPFNEQHGASSKSGILSSELTKQFGNINEMSKELDLLLSSIEEAGGFIDACTRSLRSSIEALEQGMDTLSKKCKMWMCQIDGHHEEVHCLLNKTIQVVARKIYMEGIYKQASDSRYWDLWSRQKLNSELELKQQHILSLNQDLTNQLIELERHFNALELNKFSQYGCTHISHGTLQSRYAPSRYIQSLYSLHNVISSQLVAAENLSECLSKQMTALSLRSLSEEQKNVKELFDTIGIPYEASFGSPDRKGFMKTPSNKKLLFSDLTTNKDQSKRIQQSAMKSCEPEMARRRRDSLDQSWTCFEPPKTIVKRMLLQELQKPNMNRSFFSMNREKIKTSMLDKSAPHQTDTRTPSLAFPAFKVRAGIPDSHLEEVSEHSKAFIWADNLQAPTQLSEFKSPVLQRINVSTVPSWPASQLSPAIMHGHSTDTQDMAAEKSSSFVQKFDFISKDENKSSLHAKMPQKSSISTYSTTETPLKLIKSSEMNMTTSSTTGNQLSSASTPESWRKLDFPSSPLHSSASAASTLLGKVTEFDVVKSQPDESISAIPSFGGSCESPSSPIIKTLSASSLLSSVSSATEPSTAVSVALSRCLTSSNSGIESNRIISTSSASASPSPVVSSSVSLSNQAPKHTVSSLPYSTLESLESEIQPASVSNSKTDLDATKEAVTQLDEPLNGESEFKVGPSGKFSRPSEQSSNNITNSGLNVISVPQPEQPSDALMQLSTSFPASSSNGKNWGLDVGISDEDEMDEEAPETSNTTELSLVNLGRFGISSIPNSSTPNQNPFGDSFSKATSLPSSTLSFSVAGGDLFRPASFTFPSSQSSAPAQSTNSGAFSGGFSAGAAPAPTPSVFGQPAQIGSGQQVLGSVLGTFGQSRQLGGGLHGSSLAAPSGYGGGFASSGSTSGFSSAATGGGFAGVASTGGGFAGVASTGGGFSGLASPVGGFAGGASAGSSGFAGGGFAAVSTGGFAGATSGGGFGAFSSQGSGGFTAFGTVGGSKPPELFTQMRK